MGDAADVIVKRMSVPQSTITTSAAGVVVVTLFNTQEVESIPASEWASFAARYQQYRVRAVRLTAKAINPVQSATVTHGQLFLGDYIGTAAPSSAAQVLSDERGKIVNTYKDFMYEVDWSRNPNAKLWNPTSAAIPNANVFGIAVGSSTPALSVSTNYFAISLEWVVEFRGAQ